MNRKFIEDCKKATLHFELVTPVIAKEWLQLNTNNYRTAIPRTLKKYSTEMSQGLWTVNTGTISFSSDDTLIDGQHRLLAIVDSGVAIWTYVMRNCPNEFCIDPNQDKGTARSAVQFLQDRVGVKNACMAIASMRYLYRLGIGNDGTRSGHNQLTDAQVIAAMPHMSPIFFESIDKVAASTLLSKLYKKSVMASAVFLALSHDANQGCDFVSVLMKQIDASSSHPANVLREFCTANKKLISEARFFELFFTAFNLAIKGETRLILRPRELPEFSAKQKEALAAIVSAATRVAG